MGLGSLLKKIPIVGGAFDDSQEKVQGELAKNQSLWGDLQLPNSQWQAYDPESETYTGDYDPESMTAAQISEDPLTRSAQMSALSKMAGLSDTGLSDVDSLGYMTAERNAAKEAKGSRDAALSDARSRGVGGSGLEFALREMGSQSASNRSQEAAMQVAADSAKQRALYNEAYLSGLGNVRSQDFSANQANTNIINDFNKANTTNANNAALRNLDARQTLNNANVATNNSASQYNIAGQQNANQQNFANQVTKLSGQTGANTSAANAYAAAGAAEADRRKALGSAVGAGVGYATGGPEGAKVGSSVGGGIS